MWRRSELVNLDLKRNSNETRLCICRMILEVQWADQETQHRREGGILRGGLAESVVESVWSFRVLEMS